jgi:hypothetical protein
MLYQVRKLYFELTGGGYWIDSESREQRRLEILPESMIDTSAYLLPGDFHDKLAQQEEERKKQAAKKKADKGELDEMLGDEDHLAKKASAFLDTIPDEKATERARIEMIKKGWNPDTDEGLLYRKTTKLTNPDGNEPVRRKVKINPSFMRGDNAVYDKDAQNPEKVKMLTQAYADIWNANCEMMNRNFTDNSVGYGRLIKLLLENGYANEAGKLWRFRPLTVDFKTAVHVLEGCVVLLQLTV